MPEKRGRRGVAPRVGLLIGAAFWIAILGVGGWYACGRWRRGEWPWGGGRSWKLDGITILGRKSWGAGPQEGAVAKMPRPTRITVHHSGGRPAQEGDRAAGSRTIKAMQDDHKRRRGWCDIGYHFVVDRGGQVWEGRPLDQVGAHAGSAQGNQGNIGVVLLGNFALQSPGPAQLESCERLLEALRRKFRIEKNGVYSHQEIRRKDGLGPTDCPGKHLAAWIERYRRGDTRSASARGARATGERRSDLVQS